MPQAKNARNAPEIDFPKVQWQHVRTALWRGDARADAQPPLLFINGIGGNLEMAQPLADGLGGSRHLIAFDVPGTGESEEPKYPYRPWMIARMANQLVKHWGFDGEHDVFGVSWGGGIAQQYAFQFQKQVAKVILAATSAGMIMMPGNPAAMMKLANNRRYTDPDYMLKNYEAMYGDTDPSMIRNHAMRVIPPTGRGYMFQLMAMAGWTSVPFLPLLPQDVLVMAGDQDNLVPMINSRFLTTLIRNAELDVVEGGGHLFMLAQIERTISSVTRFLNEGRDVADISAPGTKPLTPSLKPTAKAEKKSTRAKSVGAKKQTPKKPKAVKAAPKAAA